jgi:hypothetical protein
VGEETKRYRPNEDTTEVIQVSRRERSTLLQEFQRNQRWARKQYKASIRALWDAELAEDPDNGSDTPGEDLDSEVEAEAFEDYLFTKMMRYDGDSAFQLVEFRNTLRIVPERLGGPNRDLIRDRTMALWEGLRRVYFGTAELSPARDPARAARAPIRTFNARTDALFSQGISEGQRDDRLGESDSHLVPPDEEPDPVVALEIDDLRREIAELEARARLRRGPDDSGRPLLPFRLEEDDDEPDPRELMSDFSSSAHGCPRVTAVESVPPAASRNCSSSQQQDYLDHDEGTIPEFDGFSSGEPANGEDENKSSNRNGEFLDSVIQSSDFSAGFLSKDTRTRERIFLTAKTLRRILHSKESIFKYGVFVPRSDNEADASPEHVQWSSGRTLEWMRLQGQGTFERDWDWIRVTKCFPKYQKRDIGHLFFVYDFKFSGEHRVRLVFDGSRQNPETYNDTYAPTGRGESVRLFHIVAVEESWDIAQYDVPQAFLKSKIDCDIFVYPPRNFREFPNQLLKLRLSLYGAKQSAALWNGMIDKFLRGLGFIPSPMDPCLYRRIDALIILFVDDLRVAATSSVLREIHAALYKEYQITTSDGTRFLGMDTLYDLKKGYLKLHMETYIETIHQRFHGFDVTKGFPFREVVGCMMWVCLNVMGPELLRVKDLARRSNEYTGKDYYEALKVLNRIHERRTHGIVILRGGAGTEIVPSSTRSSVSVAALDSESTKVQNDDTGFLSEQNELREKALYKVRDEIADLDIQPVILPLNERYHLIIYADASFAVGERMQSVSGLIVYLNGVPLLWGSLKQTVVVDSSCSAEFVAASVACKQAIHAENMIGFLGFSCPKPYLMYTDSTACLSIASNAMRLGNVRHLAIRYHLVRCYVSIGEITMRYCVTEEMVADLMTKIVAGAQDARLAVRFYTLCPKGFRYVDIHV